MRRSRAMGAGAVVIGVVTAVFVVTGCEWPVPRVVDPGFLSDQVQLWIAKYPMANFEFSRPRITMTEIYADGNVSDIRASQGVFDSKYGWSESATFPVPQNVKTIKIKARVRTGGSDYIVNEDWKLNENGWYVSGSSVTPIN